MVMHCSAYLRPAEELRSFFIERRIEELAIHYSVAFRDRDRFLKDPEIENVRFILKYVNMTVNEIVAYLGEDFEREWGRDNGKEE